MSRPVVRRLLITGGVLFLLAQTVPYGWSHPNPSAASEPSWDTPRTRELAVRACYDCHSNQTRWPWYSYVAPVSWLVRQDVEQGRAKLNFNELNRTGSEAAEAAESVQKGEMPLARYLPTHPEARLSASERAELIRGLQATFGGERPAVGTGDHERHED